MQATLKVSRIVLVVLAAMTAHAPAAELEPIGDKLIVLTFDDSVKSHFSVVRPILLDYGFGATFFITEGFEFKTNKQDYMTWAEIRQLHDDGFEIGNHTRDHKDITKVSDLSAQLSAINARCCQYGIPRPTSFAYPGNQWSLKSVPRLHALGIRFARRGGEPEFPYKSGRGVAYEPGRDHPLLIPTAGDARPDWTLADLKRAVEQARNHRIAVLQFHGVPDRAHPWVHTPADQFRLYMKFLSLNGYRVIALRDLARFVDPNVCIPEPLAIIEQRRKSTEKAKSATN